jgi:ABC-type nitrate/sulfonate/bicarbonate transport system ATPase subunit
MSVLVAKGVGFDYGSLRVIDGLDLEVGRNELLACVGPSGCGKSTLLSLLAGHIAPTRGTIVRTGASRTVYQDGGLFPWLTVRQNIALGNPKKVGEWLEITRLTEFGDHYAHQLSGGMRQRVEIARALAAETDILLMDEPFGALDYQTRNRMRRELVATLAERPRSVVFVTHDIEEAVQIGDRVVVLDTRPARVRRVLELPGGRSRAPAAPGVAEAEQTIMEELGL